MKKLGSLLKEQFRKKLSRGKFPAIWIFTPGNEETPPQKVIRFLQKAIPMEGIRPLSSISECLQTDITSSRWYDAVFNNERQCVETLAQACIRIITCGWPEKGYFK